jgi:hypothetical protein
MELRQTNACILSIFSLKILYPKTSAGNTRPITASDSFVAQTRQSYYAQVTTVYCILARKIPSYFFAKEQYRIVDVSSDYCKGRGIRTTEA